MLSTSIAFHDGSRPVKYVRWTTEIGNSKSMDDSKRALDSDMICYGRRGLKRGCVLCSRPVKAESGQPPWNEHLQGTKWAEPVPVQARIVEKKKEDSVQRWRWTSEYTRVCERGSGAILILEHQLNHSGINLL